jgi:hypothetical protein
MSEELVGALYSTAPQLSNCEHNILKQNWWKRAEDRQMMQVTKLHVKSEKLISVSRNLTEIVTFSCPFLSQTSDWIP